MPLTKVLIQFVSQNPAENVISAAALAPEILIPVGYGSYMTEAMRSRNNYFFHRRRISTIMAEPVQLEPYLAGDIENRLEQLLQRYEAKMPIVDISYADQIEAMALGTVLRAHKSWRVTVLDKRIRESMFLPLKYGDYLKQLAFPKITQAEFAYLRNGTVPGEEAETRGTLVRKDLTKPVIRVIRTLSMLYAEGPAYWRDVVQRLIYVFGKDAPYQEEYLVDTAQLGIADRAFEELRDAGVLKVFGRQNSISRFAFADEMTWRLFLHIERIPILNVFLAAAFVREYGRSAAYHDLTLHDYSYVTGIHNCLPVVMAVYRETEEAEQIYRFHTRALSCYDEPVRKILVRFGQATLPSEPELAARLFDVEIIPVQRLSEALEPR